MVRSWPYRAGVRALGDFSKHGGKVLHGPDEGK